MTYNKIILEKIKDSMALNAYESKIYIALLSRGISSAGELSDISRVPRSRCYDVLESLEKKGFVFQKVGKPIKYIAVPPEETINVLKKQVVKEEDRLNSLYEELKGSDVFSELTQLYSTGINYIDQNDLSHAITGKANINQFIEEMMSRAKKEIHIITSKEGSKRKLKILNKLNKSKVKIILSAPVEKINNSKIEHNNQNYGIRAIKADDELLFFTSHEETDPEYETAIWMKSKFTTDSIINFL